MQIVEFLNKTWSEIPEQDNPAKAQAANKEGVLVHDSCIMIFKGIAYHVTEGGFVVAFVPYRGDITKLGVFWESEIARLFADTAADRFQQCYACNTLIYPEVEAYEDGQMWCASCDQAGANPSC